MRNVYRGNLVLPDRIFENAYLETNDGIITYYGTDKPMCNSVIEVKNYIAPGFVDIHCHDSRDFSGYTDPDKVSAAHYKNGTTSMLITYYRGETHEDYIKFFEIFKSKLPEMKNVLGIHFEGPYLNANFGASRCRQDYPIKDNYQQYIDTGLIRQWTCSPEVDGSVELIRDIKKAGITPAVGHSCANIAQVNAAIDAGAEITTHIFDATSTTPVGKSYLGTHDVSFDEACMLNDNMKYYEVICDSKWIHVKKDMLKFLVKVVGIDKIVAISDCVMESKDNIGGDINLSPDGEIDGSLLSMNGIAENLFNAGFTFPQIAKMTALNGAKAIKYYDRGAIAVGMKAHLIEVNEKYSFIKHI